MAAKDYTICEGMMGLYFAKTRREFLYNGQRYKKLEAFLEAIKDVEFKENKQ